MGAARERVRAVVIGGGAVGASCLYHLALRGWTDCLLLERDELTSGSTWHAAGNCPTFSTSRSVMRLQQYSAALYRRLGGEVDYPINYHVTGSLRLAHTEARMDEYRHVLDVARGLGLAYELLTPEEARGRYPFLKTDDLLGALWDPEDGDIDPAQLTQALAAGARRLGAVVRRGTRVTGLEPRGDGGGWLVRTGDGGEIACEVVVNAAGYRAGEVMALLGRPHPIVAMQHQYLVMADVPELAARGEARLPLLRDPDVSYYLRQERHGLLLGPYERAGAKPMWLDGIPDDFAYGLWEDDLDRLEPYIEAACARVPILGTVGVRRVVNGPIPYAPDGLPYVGPARGLPGLYHCDTFSFGIAQAGGGGRALAEWVVDGGPAWDLWAIDRRRYGPHATPAFTVAKAVELYEHEYDPAFPFEERPAGRPLATSPLHATLAARGARFGARGGWEQAVYFDPDGTVGEPVPSFRRRRNWFEAVGREVLAVREAAGLLDLPGLAIFAVEGPGAAAALDRLLCTRLPPVGGTAPGYALDARGRILSEFEVARPAEDRFLLRSAAEAGWHDADLLEAALPTDGSARLEELTGHLGTLVLAGPRAAEIMAAADLAGGADPRPTRLGEDGYELHLPVDRMIEAYERLLTAGAPHGLHHIGIYAAESLRLEAGLPAWKVDLDTGVGPDAAGLGHLVDLGKPDFVGRDALLAERERGGPAERLVRLILDGAGGEMDPLPSASVLRGGERVGIVTSAGWSYTLGQSVALAYLRADLAAPDTRVEVMVLGEPRSARVGAGP